MFKPMEFTKKEKILIRDYLNYILTKPILKAYLKGVFKRCLRRKI
jgi:hypothetical protein